MKQKTFLLKGSFKNDKNRLKNSVTTFWSLHSPYSAKENFDFYTWNINRMKFWVKRLPKPKYFHNHDSVFQISNCRDRDFSQGFVLDIHSYIKHRTTKLIIFILNTSLIWVFEQLYTVFTSLVSKRLCWKSLVLKLRVISALFR